jgi:hypothetical protein
MEPPFEGRGGVQKRRSAAAGIFDPEGLKTFGKKLQLKFIYSARAFRYDQSLKAILDTCTNICEKPYYCEWL